MLKYSYMWKKPDPSKKFIFRVFEINVFDFLFPKFCAGCGKEGKYLCEDCLVRIDISQNQYCLCQNQKPVLGIAKCQKCSPRQLDGLYFASSYQNKFLQNLIKRFKYEPFVKNLAEPLSLLIINHFQLLDNPPDFSGFFLTPIPLDKKRLKWRGFNQAEELAKKLSEKTGVPVFKNVLIKTKKTKSQTDLSEKERKENIRGAFLCGAPEKVRGKNFLLIDDVYTTGATMEETAKVLKQSGAQKVIGVVIARG